jgi:hypothetical protein
VLDTTLLVSLEKLGVAPEKFALGMSAAGRWLSADPVCELLGRDRRYVLERMARRRLKGPARGAPLRIR